MPDLVVVDPSVEFPEIEGTERVRRAWPGESTIVRPALVEGEERVFLADLRHPEAVVVMGSRASVTDDLPWLHELMRWLTPIVDGRLESALLGFCFGHQLLAHLAGGEVGPRPHGEGKLVDVTEVELLGCRLLPSRTSLQVVSSHRDAVLSLPPRFRSVGRGIGSDHEIIEHATRPLFGVQFHPEAGREFARGAGLHEKKLSAEVLGDGDLVLEAFCERAARPKG